MAKFVSIDSALAEIERARHSSRLQTAIGLARLAISQFPGQPELRHLIADLYLEARQFIHARNENLQAQRFAARIAELGPARDPLASQDNEGPAIRLPGAVVPASVPSVSILTALLPASGPTAETTAPLVPVPCYEELLQVLDPLVVELVQLESSAMDVRMVPEEAKELIRESRRALRESQGMLRQRLAHQRPAVARGVAFTSNLAPVTQTYFTHFSSHGPEVLALQKLLNRERLSVPYSSIYDAVTQKAVYALQERYGIQRTGVVDADMREILNQLASRHKLTGEANMEGNTGA